MKRAQYYEWSNEPNIKIEEVPVPEAKADEVLVKVKAAGVNPIDWKVKEGHYAQFFTEPFPFPMGWDFSGEVISVGREVKQYKPKDEVYGLIRFFEPAGCFAQYVTAPISQISHKPNKMDYVHAAGVPLVALTAWQALFETGKLQPNQTVLIHAGAGAVGQMAIQLAKHHGSKVVSTGSGKSKDFILNLGADQFIDYQSEHFDQKISDIDLVLDLVGGNTTDRSLTVLKNGGHLISFTQPISSDVQTIAKSKDINAQFTIVEPNGAQLKNITQLIDDGVLHINVEKTFSLDLVNEALALQKTGHCHGKVIITL